MKEETKWIWKISGSSHRQVASMHEQMDENSIIRMAGKLSAFCDVIIKGVFRDDTTIKNLIAAIDWCRERTGIPKA